MGYWGVKSYEGDDAADALDAAFDRVYGARYEELMDDRSPLSYEQVQEKLASPETLAAAVEVLNESFGLDAEAWDEEARLAFAGMVVRHAELKVAIPEPWRQQALAWLEHEDIDWEEADARWRRRQQEIALLGRSKAVPGPE